MFKPPTSRCLVQNPFVSQRKKKNKNRQLHVTRRFQVISASELRRIKDAIGVAGKPSRETDPSGPARGPARR